jgi:CIC family chloride channel protein
MALLALAVGVIAGFGAIIFRILIAFFHNLLFLGELHLGYETTLHALQVAGQLSFVYDANQHTPPPFWAPWVILVPVIGALGVAFLVNTFAPEAKGHGVPEVMDAIYYNQGRIRPVVVLVKSVASALSIGSGGSVGREGPIIQIGSTFGSTLGQLLHLPTKQCITLIAAGASGGIAATFNTPIGGLAFAVELMLSAINARTLMPVAMATVIATYIGRYFLGLAPAFDIPELTIPTHNVINPMAFFLFTLFGILTGLLAALFIHSLYWFEDRFDALPGNYYSRHVLGMLLVGVLLYLMMKYTNRYYVEGVGYATIEDVLRGEIDSVTFLLFLVAAKLLATCLTLGSGASGGIFSPSLFLGATLGGCYGLLVEALLPGVNINLAAFAVAGMAGMVAGATGAVLTAIIMLFEMTRDYNAILPVMLTAATAYLVRKMISHPSIYTLKLLRRGHVVPEGLQAAIDAARQVGHVMSRDFFILAAQDSLEQYPDDTKAGVAPVVVVQDQGIPVGVLHARPAQVPETKLGEVAEANYLMAAESDNLIDVLTQMHEQHLPVALVFRNHHNLRLDDLVGVISDRQIAALARQDANLLESEGG